MSHPKGALVLSPRLCDCMPDMARFPCFENLLCQVEAFCHCRHGHRPCSPMGRRRCSSIAVVRRVATCMFKDGPVNSPRPSLRAGHKTFVKKLLPLLDLCVSSLRRGHANLLCIVPILTDDPRRESSMAAAAGRLCEKPWEEEWGLSV